MQCEGDVTVIAKFIEWKRDNNKQTENDKDSLTLTIRKCGVATYVSFW